MSSSLFLSLAYQFSLELELHAHEARAVELKLSGISVDDVYFLSALHISWPELTQHLMRQQDASKANNLLNPGTYRPWPLE
jgi:hypothetical protein